MEHRESDGQEVYAADITIGPGLMEVGCQSQHGHARKNGISDVLGAKRGLLSSLSLCVLSRMEPMHIPIGNLMGSPRPLGSRRGRLFLRLE